MLIRLQSRHSGDLVYVAQTKQQLIGLACRRLCRTCATSAAARSSPRTCTARKIRSFSSIPFSGTARSLPAVSDSSASISRNAAGRSPCMSAKLAHSHRKLISTLQLLAPLFHKRAASTYSFAFPAFPRSMNTSARFIYAYVNRGWPIARFPTSTARAPYSQPFSKEPRRVFKTHRFEAVRDRRESSPNLRERSKAVCRDFSASSKSRLLC